MNGVVWIRKGILLVILLSALYLSGCSQTTVATPGVGGMPFNQAQSAVADVGLTLGRLPDAYSNTVPAGRIISQTPPAGSPLEPSSVVFVVVSLGPEEPREGEGEGEGETAPQPTLSVTPASRSVGSASGSTTFSILTTTDWTASSNEEWATLSGTSGTGDAALFVNYTANSSAARNTVITITAPGANPGSVTVTVTQETVMANEGESEGEAEGEGEAAPQPKLSVTPASRSVGAASGSISFSIQTTTAWTASSNAAWATLGAPSGTGNASLTVNYTVNTGAARSAAITITAPGASPGSVAVAVTQSAAPVVTLSVTPSSNSVSATSGSTTFSIQTTAAWTASSNAGWATLGASSGTGNATLTVNCAANNSAARSAAITVTAAGASPGSVAVAVTQSAAPVVTLSVTPSSNSVSATSGSTTFSIQTTAAWTASSNAGWATLGASSGTGNATLTANFTANSGAARSAAITVTAAGASPGSVTVTLTQQAAITAALSVSPASRSVSVAAGSTTFSIQTTVAWTASSNAAWATLGAASGTGNATLTVNYKANTGAARSASITIAAPSASPGSAAVTITQAAQSIVDPVAMVSVPASWFEMGDPWNEGSDNEVPVHDVYLDAYQIGKYEITNQQFADILNWARGRGYLTNSTRGAYTGGIIYAYGQIIAETQGSTDYSNISYSGGVFGARNRTGYNNQSFSMAEHPMINVTWYGAVCYCNWLSEKQSLQPCYDTVNWTRYEPVRNGYRLPTEAEWERAAKWDGSRHWRYGMTSDTIDFTRANYYDLEYGDDANPLGLTTYPYTSPAGWYNGVNPARASTPGTLTVNAVSPAGTYDMSGNVWEWCHDWWCRVYTTDPIANPMGPTWGLYRLLRGGSWAPYPPDCRAACRDYLGSPDSRSDSVGFRVACASD